MTVVVMAFKTVERVHVHVRVGAVRGRWGEEQGIGREGLRWLVEGFAGIGRRGARLAAIIHGTIVQIRVNTGHVWRVVLKSHCE